MRARWRLAAGGGWAGLGLADHPVQRRGRHPRGGTPPRPRAARAAPCCIILPVSAETVSTGAYERKARRSATSILAWARPSASSRSHLLSTMTMAVPAASTRSASRWSWWRHAFVGVDHEQRGVGAVDRLERAHEAEVLGRLVDLAAPAHAGGVDEAQRPVVGLDDGVDRVARGAGHVVHDRALVAHEAVEQRRLADVRAADDRDREDAVVGRRRSASSARGLGQRVDERVEEVAAPPAVDGRHRVRGRRGRAGRSPTTRSRGGRRRPCWRRASTGWSLRCRMRATCASSSVMPTVTSTTSRITSASAMARSACALTWRASACGAVTRGRAEPAAGVDDDERAAVPVGLEHLAVAGDAGLLLDDRVAPADEAVDQRRLADVGAADDGDDGERRRSIARTARDERGAVGGDDLDRAGQVGERGAVEEPAVREHDVGEQERSPSGSAVEARATSGPVRRPVTPMLPPKKRFGDREQRAPARRPRPARSSASGREHPGAVLAGEDGDRRRAVGCDGVCGRRTARDRRGRAVALGGRAVDPGEEPGAGAVRRDVGAGERGAHLARELARPCRCRSRAARSRRSRRASGNGRPASR